MPLLYTVVQYTTAFLQKTTMAHSWESPLEYKPLDSTRYNLLNSLSQTESEDSLSLLIIVLTSY